MRIWLQYMKAQAKAILTFLLFSMIFTLSFALYHLPLSAVLYAAALCAFLGAVFLTLDYLSFLKKHRRLQTVLKEATVTIGGLPPASSLPEEDYQAILQTLHQEKAALEDWMQHRYTDLVEYYTAWAHQIKTPISSLHLHLQQEEDEPRRRALMEGLQQIEQYVEMVLCYLRLDAEVTDYVIQDCSLDDILRQAIRRFASQFIQKKIKLVYVPLDFTALTDEKWLLFVLEQLISNALKYTRGSGTITIAMEESGILLIRDTGIGIAPEDLPRIFEKGYTGYNGRSDKKASGIGLYLCRRICKNLGHGISATSSPGSGTVIRLDLNHIVPVTD